MRWPFRKDRRDDIERELAAHLEAEAAENRDCGLSASEAGYAAQRALGNTTKIKEDTQHVWISGSFERLAQDIRFSLRVLAKNRTFSIFAVLALALGLGANAAIFGVVDAVLLRALPFRDAGRLVEIWEDTASFGIPQSPLAPANFEDLKKRNHAFSDMAALKGDLYALTGAGTPEQLEGSPVTANLFPLLGVAPIAGRGFSKEDDVPGGTRVALIGFALWQRRFAGDAAIVGKEIWLNAEKYTVIGVMPRGVTFPEKSEIWVPLGLSAQQWSERDNHYLRAFARLRDGVPMAAARRETSGLAAQLSREYPQTNAKIGALVVSLRDQLVGDLKPMLWGLAAGVGCVLFITCANVAGLLLTRGSGREREFAVRLALGAGRFRLIRQMLVESLLLAAFGGALGMAIAKAALPFLQHLVPGTVSSWSVARLDMPLVVFLLLASTLAALLFGTAPALFLSQPHLATALREGGRIAAAVSTRMRKALIVGEVSLALMLVVSAGLLMKTMWQLGRAPLGFEPTGVLTLRTALPVSGNSGYDNFPARAQFYRRVLEEVTAIPGVTSAGYTTFLPLTNSGGTSPFVVEDAAPLAPGESNDANHRAVSADYFRTMGVRLRAGRFFRESDSGDAPPVAMINESMAREYWPHENPLGRRLQLGRVPDIWFRIVGVVDDVREAGIEVRGRPEMYFPYMQPWGTQGYLTPRDLAVRVTGDPMRYATAVEGAIWRVDRNQPIADVAAMNDLIEDKLVARAVALKLIGTFAAIALLLSALGLYGLLAYTVSQRRREIGVRMALGADVRQVSLGVLREGFRLVAMGIAIGSVASWVAMRSLSSVLYGVAANDPLVLAAAIAVLLLVGLLASFAPARRAAAIDPMTALRYE